MLVGAVLGLACISEGRATVEDDSIPQPSIRVTDIELQVIFWRWRNSLSPEERAVLDKEIMWREDLLIHVFLGHIPKYQSRGGKTALAKKARDDRWCTRHPEAEGLPEQRNWDSMYDPQTAAYQEEQMKIPQPLEAALHHEFFGHILPALRDPSLLDRIRNSKQLYWDNERQALAIENKYRRHSGLPEVREDWVIPAPFLPQGKLPESSTP